MQVQIANASELVNGKGESPEVSVEVNISHSSHRDLL